MAETLTREGLGALAEERLSQFGEPTSKREDWRYVKLKEASALEPAARHPQRATEAHRSRCETEANTGSCAVIVDGQLVDAGGLDWRREPDDRDRERIAAAIEAGEHADLQTCRDGGEFLGLELRGLRETPVRIVHYLTGGEPRLRLHLRALAGSATDLTVHTVHLDRARSHVAIDCELEAGATLRIDELEPDDAEAIGVNLVSKRGRVAGDATLTLTTALQSGLLLRHCAAIDLLAPHAEVDLGGSTVANGHGQAHHVVRLRHRAGAARSRQTFKAVADDHGLVGFDGMIHVDEGADETDALQQSNNLQLSPTARIATRPQLDIYTDEVVASHGATIGQPDLEELAYLRTRGLDRDLATALIVEGFLREGLERMGPLREQAERSLIGLLHG